MLKKSCEWIYRRIATVLFRLFGRRNKTGLFFFESFHGKQYSGNPKAIYEYLKEHYPEFECIWAVKKGYEAPFKQNQVPYVRRMSLKWMYTMARAQYWVVNTRLPLWMEKSKHTIYVQTWHGTPLKKLGLDIQSVTMHGTNTRKYHKDIKQESLRWDYLVSPNQYSTPIFRRAFNYDGPVLEEGYPSNDVFIREAKKPVLGVEIRQKLGLSTETPIVLYAPTWRDNQHNGHGGYSFENQFPFDELLALDPSLVILTRMHYLVEDSADEASENSRVWNMSKYPEIADLFLIADYLITDYSTVMFDFLLMEKPIFLYMYDYEVYKQEIRGLYLTKEDPLPGKVVLTKSDLISEFSQALKTADGTKFSHKLDTSAYVKKEEATFNVIKAIIGG
ncbi:CDP-glycerol glycerophosphotransferase family protein [Carnobacterium gallinarum]|uniref:CDP-glycerol glycerophosphotransferase family protein n=1 Tax=Carnobacterium gallinarum TaxID=2749 RepID=UPI00055864DF|nr:CDP-glycerol glycerophosphotransferase family protein [Carnobacterium gallinarum]